MRRLSRLFPSTLLAITILSAQGSGAEPTSCAQVLTSSSAAPRAQSSFKQLAEGFIPQGVQSRERLIQWIEVYELWLEAEGSTDFSHPLFVEELARVAALVEEARSLHNPQAPRGHSATALHEFLLERAFQTIKDIERVLSASRKKGNLDYLTYYALGERAAEALFALGYEEQTGALQGQNSRGQNSITHNTMTQDYAHWKMIHRVTQLWEFPAEEMTDQVVLRKERLTHQLALPTTADLSVESFVYLMPFMIQPLWVVDQWLSFDGGPVPHSPLYAFGHDWAHYGVRRPIHFSPEALERHRESVKLWGDFFLEAQAQATRLNQDPKAEVSGEEFLEALYLYLFYWLHENTSTARSADFHDFVQLLRPRADGQVSRIRDPEPIFKRLSRPNDLTTQMPRHRWGPAFHWTAQWLESLNATL